MSSPSQASVLVSSHVSIASSLLIEVEMKKGKREAPASLSEDRPVCFHGTPPGQPCAQCDEYLRRVETARNNGDWKALELLSKEMKQGLLRYRGGSLTFYVPGKTTRELQEIRKNLNAIAATFGYTAERGRTAGDGTTGRLLVDLAEGKLLLIRSDSPIEKGKPFPPEQK